MQYNQVDQLRISLVQADLQWEAPDLNKERLQRAIDPLQGRTDLILLPEMFTTGFSMNAAQLAEEMEGPSMRWMQDRAKQLDAGLLGSLIIREGGTYRNRLIFMRPEGEYYYYDKKHLFVLAGEDLFEAGAEQLIVEWKGWKIMPLICYDLRFPVWSRNVFDYDLLVYVANWPNMRLRAWQTLLQARAIENMAYVAGVNRIGRDGHDYPYSGSSSLVSFDGSLLYQCMEQEDVFTATLSRQPMLAFREKLPFLEDRDSFRLYS